ncbi:MAG TPA: efflux RND transporter periplasmic adaptor subunit [Myxococcota bacterium]|nr:efflux RND transporter periplasmic adaptor subunit [Myxococcota bacterium]HRY92185.1 efflux RND transporter periplasmic adaptor subunit [Myxococcota bacterium]HSA21716.1 efflux RND transporter periplasmic adaptor subunit [Myxococcota bacterium]
MQASPRRIALLGAALGLLALAGCASQAAPEKRDRPAPLVQVRSVAPEDHELRRAYLVTLLPAEQVQVVSRASGYVVAWLVDRGDRVRRGQRLALIEREEMNEQQRQAAAGLQAARANHEYARTNLERLERLLAQQLVSQAEVDNARTAANLAQAQVDAAQAGLGLSETRAGYANITAPFDGVVLERLVDVGAMVGPGGAPLFQLGAIGRVKALAAVPQADLRFITLGTPVSLRLEGLDGALPGAVRRFAPALDPATRTMEVELEFENPAEALKPGMFGRAEIVLERLSQAILAPPLAVSRRDQGGVAFVVADGKARQVELQLGATLPDGRIVITAGLRPGDVLIVVGRELVRDGQAVRTVEAQKL